MCYSESERREEAKKRLEKRLERVLKSVLLFDGVRKTGSHGMLLHRSHLGLPMNGRRKTGNKQP